MLESKSFEKRGKEIETYYASRQIIEMWQKNIIRCVVMIVCVIVLIAVFVLGKIITKTFIVWLGIAIAALLFSALMAYYNMLVVQKNRVCIYENCVVGTAAFGTARSFEAAFDDIADVQINTARNNLECIEIRIRNSASPELSTYACFINDCYSAANTIKSRI